jgi:hypothetical protein
MWFHAFTDRYFPSRRDKIVARIAQIDDDLKEQEKQIKACRIRLDDFTWLRPSFERHDEFTSSMIAQIKDEKRYREHRVNVLLDEHTDLTARLKRLQIASAAVPPSRVSVYS